MYVEQGGKMVSGKVVEVSSQTQYEVSFEDGSVCSNLGPGDIVVSYICQICWYSSLSGLRILPAVLHSRAPS